MPVHTIDDLRERIGHQGLRITGVRAVPLSYQPADGSCIHICGPVVLTRMDAGFVEVRTDQGRYRAWGQMLDVETGLIRFNGPYNNPSLDILALRPNISVRAGVQVTESLELNAALENITDEDYRIHGSGVNLSLIHI